VLPFDIWIAILAEPQALEFKERIN
jgi:hypothetical protein